MRKSVILLATALSVVAACPAGDARADEPAASPASRLEGTYAPLNAKAAQSGIEAAVESVVQEMNFIKRPFARSKLLDTNALLSSVRFQFQGDQLTYTYNGGHVIRLVVNGPAIRWKSPADGEFYETKGTLSGRRFTLSFKGEDGSKQEVFELGTDGVTLVYQAVVTSPQLPKTLRFTYTLKRK
jgi:hypothetical protein